MGVKDIIALTEQIAAKAASWAGEIKFSPWIPTEIRISPIDAAGIRPGEKES
jgi:hypothetical protein